MTMPKHLIPDFEYFLGKRTHEFLEKLNTRFHNQWVDVKNLPRIASETLEMVRGSIEDFIPYSSFNIKLTPVMGKNVKGNLSLRYSYYFDKYGDLNEIQIIFENMN